MPHKRRGKLAACNNSNVPFVPLFIYPDKIKENKREHTVNSAEGAGREKQKLERDTQGDVCDK